MGIKKRTLMCLHMLRRHHHQFYQLDGPLIIGNGFPKTNITLGASCAVLF